MTDPVSTEGLPVGAYVAAALMAANIPCDSGEDVDRLLSELAARGYHVAAIHPEPHPDALDDPDLGSDYIAGKRGGTAIRPEPHPDSGIPTTSRELFHGHHPDCGWTVDADPKACNCRVVLSTPRTESE